MPAKSARDMMNAMRSNYKCDDIALRCKHYLKKKDMTKKEFAATLGISQQALSALLNGKVRSKSRV